MENKKENDDILTKDIEEIAYETRFLLNILMDLLVKKNVITEAEFTKEYDRVLSNIEKTDSPSKN